MAKSKPSRMIYLSGHSASKGLLGVLAFPEDYAKELEFSVFYTTLDDKWLQLQFQFDIPSLTYLAPPKTQYKAWWLVGKRGEVVEVKAGKPRIEHIATAGTGGGEKYGHLFQIRNIDNELFICGYGRQVYRRTDDGWQLISRDILDIRTEEPAAWIKSIDGFSGTDLYGVGSDGEIWHFNGKQWTDCDSPSNVHFSDVRCIDGKVWICGAKGIILCGDKAGWDEVWADEEPAERWWSIESFGGSVYVAGSRFLGIVDGSEIIPVDIDVKDSLTTATLHHKDGLLWSIGSRDILMFDGSSWTQLVCPENR